MCHDHLLDEWRKVLLTYALYVKFEDGNVKKKKHYHCTKCRYCDVTAMTGHWNMENQNALSPTRIQLKHSSCLSSLDCFNM